MTKKKKGALIISAIALVALIVVGGTLAYFTSQDTATNVFTLGKVKGDLTETTVEGKDDNNNIIKPGISTDTGIEYDKILPGDKLSKIPVVTLATDSEDAYVRVKLEVNVTNGTLTADQKKELTSTCLDLQPGWVSVDTDTTETDGSRYVYYQTTLSAGQATDSVFNVVTIPGAWDNSTAEAKFNIVLTADLVQANNFAGQLQKDASGNIISWGDVEIKE